MRCDLDTDPVGSCHVSSPCHKPRPPLSLCMQCCPANIALTTIMMANALDRALPTGASGKALRPMAALQLTFMIGVVQMVLGLCRLGAVAHYLSFPVMHGFNTAGTWQERERDVEREREMIKME